MEFKDSFPPEVVKKWEALAERVLEFLGQEDGMFFYKCIAEVLQDAYNDGWKDAGGQ